MLTDIEVDEFKIQWEAMVDLHRKLSWVTAYIRGKFFIGIRTTSQCKSLHAKLGGFVESRYGILDFVTNFQRCVDFLRDKEEELDFRSFMDCEHGCCYGIQKYHRPEATWQVLHQLHDGTFQCNFRRMELYGIPYVHIIVVLVGIDIGSLPETLVFKRWLQKHQEQCDCRQTSH
ncbi:hypothetical protein AHAS_Ahas20G0122900 [Arachis hypogaea]